MSFSKLSAKQAASNLKASFWLGAVVFAALTVLAIVFWQERTLFSDIAFQTFLMLKDGGLQIMVNRWVSGATHVWPWLAIKAGLPLHSVLFSFSLGFAFWYFLTFWGCVLLRNWRFALAAVLFSTLLVKDTFFWITSELAQGCALLFPFFAWLENQKNIRGSFRWLDWILLFFGMATLVYAHPMLAFPTLFLLCFLAIEGLDNWKFWSKSASVFAAFWLLKNQILPLNWYDAMSQERAGKIFQTFPDWFGIPANRDFLKWCLTDWWFFLPATLAVLGVYFWQKRWLKFLLTFTFSMGYLLLVNVSFAEGDKQFYLESLYLPLSIFVGVPLVFDVLPFEKRPKIAFGILAAVAFSGILRIAFASREWTARLNWEKDFLKKTATLENRKIILSENQTPMDLLKFSWGASYEFLLISSLENPSGSRCILVDENPSRFEPFLKDGDLFLGEFKNFRFDELPKKYFDFRDSSTYQMFGAPAPESKI